MAVAYETVVGLEVHAQLLTSSKLFCGCATSFGAHPNAYVCAVCLGLPGALPVLNRQAVTLAVRAAIALGLFVHEVSIFARKNYFYPDLPKGYQISQYDRPLATDGTFAFALEGGAMRETHIVRIHMEEDAGKNVHAQGADSVVDLNRAGTPLVEIVGAPDLRSGAEAAAYLKALRDVLMFVGVNDGNLEEGSFRCDANVSVRPVGSDVLGTRCEIKNVSSFKFVQKAIEHEAARHVALIESGGRVTQETRGWNEREGRTFSMRSKEEAHDYRYFPDPDLPPLVVSPSFVATERERLPETPAAARLRLITAGLAPATAAVLTAHPAIARFYDKALETYEGDAKKLANLIQGDILAGAQFVGREGRFPITPGQAAELLRLVDEGTISGKQAKEVYALIANTSASPGDVIRERGISVQRGGAELDALCQRVVEQNARQAAAYRAGKTALFGFFVGQVMKETRGSADPAAVNEVLLRLLS